MRAGDLLAQRFRIERPAGVGAMGTVFRACDLARAGCLVAVKALPSSGDSKRFEREVAALAGIDHDAVVRYVDHGYSDAGEAFVAMEWVEGQSLSERLAVSGLSGVETAVLGQRLAAGLAALHDRGLVHRDLKPSNVMLANGRVAAARIVDLGIARLPGESATLAVTGVHLGTPRYMAPEQIRDPHAVDGRADVFSLGCVLFECLTGQPAFPGEESVSVLAQVLFGHTPEASELRPDLPPELDQLLERLLSRSRKLRPFATPALIAEFSALLEQSQRARLEALQPCAARPPATARALLQTAAGETAGATFERPSVALLLPRVSADGRVRRMAPPWPRGPWVGRDAELSELCALLERDRAVTLWGGAGVGKTRLALESTRVLATVRPDRIAVFCELGEARGIADVVRIVSDRAGLPLAPHAEPEFVLGGLIAKLGDVLLVLDRCEHLAGELEALVALWLASAPGLCVLATSRSRLHTTGELELRPLATRAPGAPLTAADLPLSEAAELVLARAALALEAPEPRADPPEVRAFAERIATALDGNPLAIELAAARVPALGWDGVVARLPAQLSLLSSHGAGNTMRGAIAWSWDLLNEAERLVFMQCSVFRGSFTLAAADGVLAGDDRLIELVQALREQSLLMSSPLAGHTSQSVRLTMSAALREFAATQLAIAREQHPALAGVEARHARYYTELARHLTATHDAELRHARRLEHDNLLAAAEYALEHGQAAAAATLLFALEPALLAAGSNSSLTALLERALLAADAAQADPELARARVRLHALHARLLAPAGELARARAELLQVRVAAEALADPRLLGSVWLELGVVYHFGRQLADAAECYERALAQLALTDELVARARCHGNLGAVAHDEGRLEDAAHGYRYAIGLLEDAGEPRLLANFRGNLASIETERGRIDEARRLYEQAAGGLEALCDARLLGIVLGNWGTLELTQNPQAAAAVELFERAHALLDGCGDRRSLGLASARLGAAYALSGRPADADSCITRAERTLRRDPLASIVAGCLRGFIELQRGLAAAHAGDETDAPASLAQANARLVAARSAEHAGRPALQQSDDLRLYSALLARELERVERRAV